MLILICGIALISGRLILVIRKTNDLLLSVSLVKTRKTCVNGWYAELLMVLCSTRARSTDGLSTDAPTNQRLRILELNIDISFRQIMSPQYRIFVTPYLMELIKRYVFLSPSVPSAQSIRVFLFIKTKRMRT